MWCWSYRFTVAILCCLSLVNMHAQQSAFLTPSGCDSNASISGQNNVNYRYVACDTVSNNTGVRCHSLLRSIIGCHSTRLSWKMLVCFIWTLLMAGFLTYCCFSWSLSILFKVSAETFLDSHSHVHTVSSLQAICCTKINVQLRGTCLNIYSINVRSMLPNS